MQVQMVKTPTIEILIVVPFQNGWSSSSTRNARQRITPNGIKHPLAWSREYLARACAVLVALHERDPGGRWANRPGESAASILLPWHPQTTASVDERIQVLDYVMTRHPGGAWRLLLGLLPDAMSHTLPTQRPHWRDWATTWVA
jgi:hypothetical protein